MLKQTKVLLAPDVNTGGESSTSPDVKGAESSSAVEVVNEATETEGEKPEAVESEESTTEETDDDQTSEQKTGEETTEEVVEEVEEDEKKTEDAVPYERFTEVNTKKVELEQQIEQSKPLVEQAKITNEFLQSNNISAQEYQSALQYLRLLRTDPKQAYEMLKPTFEQLGLLTGDRLPMDLQTEVASGAISQERAAEIARARGQQTYQQWRGQQQGQQQQYQQQNVVSETIRSWASTKQTVDPDFKQGTPLWEQVDLRISNQPPYKNAQEAMAGSEKAYTEAKAFMAKLQPRVVKQVKQPLKSKQSATTNNVVMRTAEDVMKAVNAGIKPHQMRYS